MFARGTNPSIDRPFLRKSKTYVFNQVRLGRADWVDPEDPRKGIICRELLHFGYRPLVSTMPTIEENVRTLPPIELPGLRLQSSRNCEGISMAAVRANWRWERVDFA